MIVCGLDMSSTKSGYSLFDTTLSKKEQLIDYGIWQPPDNIIDWRERILWMGEQLNQYISNRHIDMIYIEDVPLVSKNPQTLKILSCLQGIILGLVTAHNIKLNFVSVTKWRSDLGLFTGKRKDTERELMKQSSINYANEQFNIDLKWVSMYSKKNDDDIADSINVAWSQIKPNAFGRKMKVGGC